MGRTSGTKEERREEKEERNQRLRKEARKLEREKAAKAEAIEKKRLKGLKEFKKLERECKKAEDELYGTARDVVRQSPEAMDALREMDSVVRSKFELTRKAGSFRWNNTKGLFTYKTHIDKKELEEHFESLRDKEAVVWFRAAHETGDEKNPYDHTHVVVKWAKSWQTTNCRYFDFDGIHCHIARITTDLYWKNAKVYLGKEDVENNDLLHLHLKSSVSYARTLDKEDLITTYGVVRGKVDTTLIMNAGKIRSLLNPRAEIVREMPEIQDWFFDLAELCSGKGSKRRFSVVYDPLGGSGKSDWVDYMELTYPGKVLDVSCCKKADMGCIMEKQILEDDWRGDTIVIDIPRGLNASGKTDYTGQLWTFLEDLKNGKVNSPKYLSSKVQIERRTHIVVFTNAIPKTRGILTVDRIMRFYLDSIRKDTKLILTDKHGWRKTRKIFKQKSPEKWTALRNKLKGRKPEVSAFEIKLRERQEAEGIDVTDFAKEMGIDFANIPDDVDDSSEESSNGMFYDANGNAPIVW